MADGKERDSEKRKNANANLKIFANLKIEQSERLQGRWSDEALPHPSEPSELPSDKLTLHTNESKLASVSDQDGPGDMLSVYVRHFL